jgi:hypothetical protein
VACSADEHAPGFGETTRALKLERPRTYYPRHCFLLRQSQLPTLRLFDSWWVLACLHNVEPQLIISSRSVSSNYPCQAHRDLKGRQILPSHTLRSRLLQIVSRGESRVQFGIFRFICPFSLLGSCFPIL